MKRFMYLSIGVLCLSLSALIGFHVGHNTAHAQLDSPVWLVRTTDTGAAHLISVWPNGDVYSRRFSDDDQWLNTYPPTFNGNFWWTSPLATERSTMGAIKNFYDTNK